MIRNKTIHFSQLVMITDTESESLSKQGKEFDMSFNHTLVKILSKGLVVKVTVIIVINNSNKLGLSTETSKSVTPNGMCCQYKMSISNTTN